MAAAALFSCAQTLCAQASPTVHSAHHAASPHKKASPAHPALATPAPEQAPLPAAPEPPKWPVNDPPTPPSIRWDSQGLQVGATNSSLRQILDDVATATGAKVEGLQGDERVFGEYGPGPAKDVISQILHGSTYNVLMLGDEGQGTPREIILSERTKVGGPAGQPGQAGQAFNRQVPQDDDVEQPVEAEEPNQQQPMNRPPGGQPINQPGAPMTPQQRMLEMQRQQMQMQQQLQNQPVQPPPEAPQ